MVCGSAWQLANNQSRQIVINLFENDTHSTHTRAVAHLLHCHCSPNRSISLYSTYIVRLNKQLFVASDEMALLCEQNVSTLSVRALAPCFVIDSPYQCIHSFCFNKFRFVCCFIAVIQMQLLERTFWKDTSNMHGMKFILWTELRFIPIKFIKIKICCRQDLALSPSILS